MRPPTRPEEWLSPYVPSPEDPFDRVKAAHLLRRAGFGVPRAALDAWVALGPDVAVERLLQPQADAQERFAALLEQIEGQLLDLSREEDLQAWWIYRMVHSPDRLREKLTLFWHGHFATSIRKVERARLMREQNETQRRLALGPVRELVLAMSRDPAMLIWLDNRVNRKGRPNENYARELMELFTLGVGNYGEDDVKQVARAFTGWTLREDRFVFDQAAHDDGPKTILGRSGRFGGEEVVDLLLAQPACARFLARRLLTFFLAPRPSEALVDAFAACLRQDGMRIDAALRTLLKSRVFHARATLRSRIKSPVEYTVGMVHDLGLKADCRGIARACASMGQTLFAPPTVKGWDGEEAWLSAQWLVARANAAMGASGLRGGSGESRFEPMPLLERGQTLAQAGALVDAVVDLLLDGGAPTQARELLLKYVTTLDRDRTVPFDPKNRAAVEAKARGLAHLVMTMPEYQLA
ncbi:MAG: DUF1800 domain-containing protein [Planctomycetes bacterium]|nr:DUF1800 domain-containing protein [Planctomycetota bacterium]